MIEQTPGKVSEYFTIVRREETTDGKYCYIAFHPEFPNSLSQGETVKEAEENLVEATELTIAHLEASNLPIPMPMSWQASSNFLQILPPDNVDNVQVVFGRSGTYENTEAILPVE